MSFIVGSEGRCGGQRRCWVDHFWQFWAARIRFPRIIKPAKIRNKGAVLVGKKGGNGRSVKGIDSGAKLTSTEIHRSLETKFYEYSLSTSLHRLASATVQTGEFRTWSVFIDSSPLSSTISQLTPVRETIHQKRGKNNIAHKSSP